MVMWAWVLGLTKGLLVYHMLWLASCLFPGLIYSTERCIFQCETLIRVSGSGNPTVKSAKKLSNLKWHSVTQVPDFSTSLICRFWELTRGSSTLGSSAFSPSRQMTGHPGSQSWLNTVPIAMQSICRWNGEEVSVYSGEIGCSNLQSLST